MSSVSIRRLAAAESPTVAALVAATVRPLPYYNERAKSEELAKYGSVELTALCASDADSVLVAWEGQKPIGFCISKYDDGLVWLCWFGVHEEHRGRHIGNALLVALQQTLALRRAHKIWCDTRTDNIRSQKVLTQFGFTRIAELKNHWYGQDFYLWECSPR
ncbi:MAG: hypothetical protein C0497_05290 [Gemmatimonas sp.]|nr:hypothetical protein [Gemmatimonas sp.]